MRLILVRGNAFFAGMWRMNLNDNKRIWKEFEESCLLLGSEFALQDRSRPGAVWLFRFAGFEGFARRRCGFSIGKPEYCYNSDIRGIADKVYFLPVTPYFEEIIKKNSRTGILLAFGGQTDCELRYGTLPERYFAEIRRACVGYFGRGYHVHGRPRPSEEVGWNSSWKLRRETHAVETWKMLESCREIGYPGMVRSAYAFGWFGQRYLSGRGSVCQTGWKFFHVLQANPGGRIPERLKEIEFRVIRDANDHCFTVASMENFDPLGIIPVSLSWLLLPLALPTQVKMLQELSYQYPSLPASGECNIQYAFNVETNDYRGTDVNASLLCFFPSKATGYFVFVAAKIALGYTLDQIWNGNSNSAYEAPLDYLICKIPRWDFTKFAGVSREIGQAWSL